LHAAQDLGRYVSTPPAKTEAVLLALTPNLQNLATVLRHREMWPTGFKWDYSSCLTCAMGLAWRLSMISDCCTLSAAEEFGIPFDVATRIFLLLTIECGGGKNVTPEHVADAIDAYVGCSPTTSGLGSDACGL
jgi:hypothetical protein